MFMVQIPFELLSSTNHDSRSQWRPPRSQLQPGAAPRHVRRENRAFQQRFNRGKYRIHHFDGGFQWISQF
jgi:hypothetical protein